jgi:hypothetical protein
MQCQQQAGSQRFNGGALTGGVPRGQQPRQHLHDRQRLRWWARDAIFGGWR